MKFKIFLVLLFASLTVFAQRIETIEKQGDDYFELGQYLNAITFYKVILEEQPTYIRAQYKLAECYRMIHDYQSAEFYYESLALDKDTRFPLSGFYFGLMQKLRGEYELAINTLQNFREFLKDNSLHEDENLRSYYKQAKIEIDGCQLALNQITLVHPEHGFQLLPEPLNSPFNDYAAFSFNHDSLVCLTSARKGGTGKLQDNQFGESFADLFRFEKKGTDWESYDSNDRFEKAVNTKWGDGSGSFNKERTKFYYTNCDNSVGEICQIYVSTLESGKWSDPTALNLNINDNEFSSKHPNLSPGGDTLFYVTDKPGGVGGLDIWMSINAGGETWGPSVNLGDEINTPFNEVSPFYDQQDEVLFFASDGHRGFGGYDIYIARGSSFKAAEIHNAGLPFNSSLDDIFFFLGEKRGYVSSNREDGIGKFDIYGFNIKSKENIIMEVSTEATVAGRNSLFTDDYNFESEETEVINQIISRMLSSEFSGIKLMLTEEQLAIFESLSQDDKDRIDKIVKSRLRKMTNSMIRSVRSEDDYYYQQLETDRRKQVDQVVTSHLEQRSLGRSIVMGNQESSFYQSIDPGEREKLEILITERVRAAEEFSINPVTYTSLPEKDRLKVDGITSRYLEQKKGMRTISLAVDQRDLMKSSDNEIHKINTAIQERILLMSQMEENDLSESDQEFYQKLSVENIGQLNSLAKTFLSSNLETFEENTDPNALEIYQDFSKSNHGILDRILLRIILNIAEADIYRIESAFESWEIRNSTGTTPTEILNEIKDRHPDMSIEIDEALKRFVLSSYNYYIENNESIFMKALPVVSISGKEEDENAVYTLEDDLLNGYLMLSGEQRLVMDKLIGVRYINKAYQDRNLESSDNGLFRSFLPYEKRHIEILAKGVQGGDLSPVEREYLSEGFTFYNAQSQNRKALLNRLVLARSFERVNGKFVLNRADASVNGSFGSEEIALIEGLEKFRISNERILTENLAVEAKDLDQVPQDVITLVQPADSVEPEPANEQSSAVIARESELETTSGRIILDLPQKDLSKYSRLVISGQLIDKETGKFLPNHPVSLHEEDSQETIIYEYTDENGNFIFNAQSDNYQLITESVSGGDDINIKNLNIEGQDNFTNAISEWRVYFDVDSENLRSEATILLKEILQTIDKNLVRIEIESHTDNTGGEHYNKALSQRRGTVVMDFLIKNGVKKSNVSLIWHGHEKPLAANYNPYGRQLNRRCEIRIFSDKLGKTNFGTVFLAKPGSTIYSVAKNLGVTVDHLQNINGTTTLKAYQPVRAKNIVGEPDYNLLMPTQFSNLSDFTYTVKTGETLTDISHKFNVPEEIILEGNRIYPSDIKGGMKLKVYKGYGN